MNTIVLTGISGFQCAMRIFSPGTRFNPVPGIYAFAGLDTQGALAIYYIGKTSSLRDRLSDHEVWPKAAVRGATHILVSVARNEHQAGLWETDLIELYRPPLNSQLKAAGSLLRSLLGNN